MNSIKDFNDFLYDTNQLNDNADFAYNACEFIDKHSNLADLAYIMRHLSKTYEDKLYYLCQKLSDLEDTFHKGARLEDTPDVLASLYAKLEDELILLQSSYRGEDDE